MNVSPTGLHKGGIPRGLAIDGPALLSYGFRPFFLGAGLFAVAAMLLWIGALTQGWEIGGSRYGALNWHAHEMLFGYVAAALAGFMLTAIPNWTGRLPVSGRPLLLLVLLWLAGRVAMVAPEQFGIYPAAVVEAAFLPVLAGIAAREIITGRNCKNLKILVALGVLSGVNITFHVMVLIGENPNVLMRAGIAVFVALIAVVGGRIVPSFTRNWLSRAGSVRLPHPYSRFDTVAIVALIAALASWTIIPLTPVTSTLALAASGLQLWRLIRWRGLDAAREPLLAILHIAYLFIPVGLAAIALSAMGWLEAPSTLHLLSVGAIGCMTLGVMTRATLGHTGRPLRASAWTVMSYLSLLTAAILRPLAEIVPGSYYEILAVAGAAWIAAFAIFSVEYGRYLLLPRAGAS